MRQWGKFITSLGEDYSQFSASSGELLFVAKTTPTHEVSVVGS